MLGKTVVILESRFGEHLAALLEKRGATVLRAPALAEEPDVDPAAIRALVESWQSRPFGLVVFQTGVGTRALFEALDALGLASRVLELLAAGVVAVRGPKPAAALRARGVRMDRSAREPFTTREVLAAVEDLDLAGRRVLVQRYGDTNTGLEEGLEARGAAVVEVPTYRWALPRDTGPLVACIDALGRGSVDAVAFTSASQVRNLFAVARRHGGEPALLAGLNATLVASIGPVCSGALRTAGVKIGLEASPPKLGPLVEALDRRMAER